MKVLCLHNCSRTFELSQSASETGLDGTRFTKTLCSEACLVPPEDDETIKREDDEKKMAASAAIHQRELGPRPSRLLVGQPQLEAATLRVSKTRRSRCRCRISHKSWCCYWYYYYCRTNHNLLYSLTQRHSNVLNNMCALKDITIFIKIENVSLPH